MGAKQSKQKGMHADTPARDEPPAVVQAYQAGQSPHHGSADGAVKDATSASQPPPSSCTRARLDAGGRAEGSARADPTAPAQCNDPDVTPLLELQQAMGGLELQMRARWLVRASRAARQREGGRTTQGAEGAPEHAAWAAASQTASQLPRFGGMLPEVGAGLGHSMPAAGQSPIRGTPATMAVFKAEPSSRATQADGAVHPLVGAAAGARMAGQPGRAAPAPRSLRLRFPGRGFGAASAAPELRLKPCPAVADSGSMREARSRATNQPTHLNRSPSGAGVLERSGSERRRWGLPLADVTNLCRQEEESRAMVVALPSSGHARGGEALCKRSTGTLGLPSDQRARPTTPPKSAEGRLEAHTHGGSAAAAAMAAHPAQPAAGSSQVALKLPRQPEARALQALSVELEGLRAKFGSTSAATDARLAAERDAHAGTRRQLAEAQAVAGSLQNQLEAHEGARSKALKRVEATFAQERAAHAQEVARLQRSEAAAVERLGTEAAARACAEADLVTLRAHLASVQKSAEADRQRLQSSMHAQVQEQVKQMEVQATRLGEENGRLQGSLQGLEGGRDREREQHAQQMQQASSAFQGLQAELAAAHAHAAALEARFAEQERLRRDLVSVVEQRSMEEGAGMRLLQERFVAEQAAHSQCQARLSTSAPWEFEMPGRAEGCAAARGAAGGRDERGSRNRARGAGRPCKGEVQRGQAELAATQSALQRLEERCRAAEARAQQAQAPVDARASSAVQHTSPHPAAAAAQHMTANPLFGEAGSPDLSAGTEGAPSTVTAAQQAALQERLAAAERERDAAKAQAARLQEAGAREQQGREEHLRARVEAEVKLALDAAAAQRDAALQQPTALPQVGAAQQAAQLAALRDRMGRMATAAAGGALARRAVHSRLTELRGNVRVLCRVKPATAPVLALGAGGAYVVADAEGGARRFDFDAVVGPEDGQAVVLAAVADLALSALDGDKASVFAMGQPGAGKSHTLHGLKRDGLIPSAVYLVRDALAQLQRRGWRCELAATCVAVYNEGMRDLLAEDAAAAAALISDKRAIRHDAHGRTFVEGARSMDLLADERAARRMLRRASGERACCGAAPPAPGPDSRMHTVLLLSISAGHELLGAPVQGSLNFIELSGSGKASRADGQQAGAEAGASAAATGLDDDLACLFGSMKVEDAPKRRGSEQPAGNSEQQAPAGGSQQQAGSDGATAPSRATRNALLNRVLQPYLGGRGKVALLAHASAEAAVLPQALQDLQGTAAIHARAAGARRLAAARAAADVRMRGTGQRSPQQEGGAFAAADGGADAAGHLPGDSGRQGKRRPADAPEAAGRGGKPRRMGDN